MAWGRAGGWPGHGWRREKTRREGELGGDRGGSQGLKVREASPAVSGEEAARGEQREGAREPEQARRRWAR